MSTLIIWVHSKLGKAIPTSQVEFIKLYYLKVVCYIFVELGILYYVTKPFTNNNHDYLHNFRNIL